MEANNRSARLENALLIPTNQRMGGEIDGESFVHGSREEDRYSELLQIVDCRSVTVPAIERSGITIFCMKGLGRPKGLAALSSHPITARRHAPALEVQMFGDSR